MGLFSCSIYLGPTFKKAKDSMDSTKKLYSKEDQKKWDKWTSQSYKFYRTKKVEQPIDSLLLEGVSFKIIGAAWCHDTREQVSKFCKILDKSNVKQSAVEYFFLDRENKGNESQFIKDYIFTKIPVIVVFKGGREIGSIIETPIKSLEEDLMAILTK